MKKISLGLIVLSVLFSSCTTNRKVLDKNIVVGRFMVTPGYIYILPLDSGVINRRILYKLKRDDFGRSIISVGDSLKIN